MKMNQKLVSVLGLIWLASTAYVYGGQNNCPTIVNATTFQNPKRISIDFSKTIQGLAVSKMLYTSDGGLLTYGTIATYPSHSILTKLSAEGKIEWEYSLSSRDTLIYINNMQEIVEITNGYEVSGSIGLEMYPSTPSDRYRLVIDKKGNLVSKWVGQLTKDILYNNINSIAMRDFYTGLNTVRTHSVEIDSKMTTPSWLTFDDNGNINRENIFSSNQINTSAIHTNVIFPTHDGGSAAVLSCDSKDAPDTAGFFQLWKFDKSGNYQWSKQLPEVYYRWYNRIYCSAIQTKDGGIAIATILESRSNPIDKKSPILLRKYDNDGNLLFTKSYAPLFNNNITSLKETPSGDLLLAGSGQENANAVSKDTKYLLIRTTPNGEVIWSDSFGETTSGNQFLNLEVVDEHSFLLGGLNNSGVGVNVTRAIVMKVRDQASSVEEQPTTNDALTLSPNPTSTSFTIGGIDNIVSVKLMNSLGVEVSRTSLVVSGKQEVDVSDLASGIYFVQMRTSTGMFTKPIVVSR